MRTALVAPSPPMNALDALLHLLNFVLPAALLGGLAAAGAKLLWRRSLQGVALARLAAWSSGAAAAVLLAGLLLTGRDGAMATYGAMVLACAAALAWAGWGRR
jgi:hypothetical protein